MSRCPVGHDGLTWVAQYGQWYCYTCQKYYQPGQPAASQAMAAATPSPVAGNGMWFGNAYRIRKKVMALTNQYWVEDGSGRTLAFSKQKAFKIKEDIRVFTEENQTQELFRIRQTNWSDAWGNFAVIDSATNQPLGYLRRKALASGFVRDEWEMFDAYQRLVGGIYESTGRGLARRLIPGGSLIPEQVTISLNGQPIAQIHQQFKIVGDVWNIQCTSVPATFDRRVLVSCALLMGMIERERK